MLRVTKSARGFALVARRHAARWGPGGARGCASVSFDWPMDIRAILDDLNAHRKGDAEAVLTEDEQFQKFIKLRGEVAMRTRHGMTEHVVEKIISDRFWDPVLAPLTEGGSSRLKVESLVLLSYAAAALPVTQRLLDMGMPERLHEFIAGGTEEVQTAACILVGNMFTMHGKDVCQKLVEDANIVAALVAALTTHGMGPTARTAAASALGAAGSEPSMHARLLSQGAVDALCTLVVDEGDKSFLRASAATALGNTIGADDREAQQRVADTGALAAVCHEITDAAAAMHAHRKGAADASDDDMTESAAWVLAATVNCNPALQEMAGKTGVVPALADLLDSPSEGIVWQAGMALENVTHAHRENSLAVLSRGTPMLHRLISVARGEGVGDTTAPLHAGATIVQLGQFLPEAGWPSEEIADVVLTLQAASDEHQHYVEGKVLSNAFDVWARVAQELGAGP